MNVYKCDCLQYCTYDIIHLRCAITTVCVCVCSYVCVFVCVCVNVCVPMQLYVLRMRRGGLVMVVTVSKSDAA